MLSYSPSLTEARWWPWGAGSEGGCGGERKHVWTCCARISEWKHGGRGQLEAQRWWGLGKHLGVHWCVSLCPLGVAQPLRAVGAPCMMLVREMRPRLLGHSGETGWGPGLRGGEGRRSWTSACCPSSGLLACRVLSLGAESHFTLLCAASPVCGSCGLAEAVQVRSHVLLGANLALPPVRSEPGLREKGSVHLFLQKRCTAVVAQQPQHCWQVKLLNPCV